MTTLLWFKRDLRLADHPALVHALRHAPVVPVYIVEPEAWAQPDAAGRHWEFVQESLLDLREALRVRGSDLVIRVGDAVEALATLVAETGAERLVSHEETGNGWSFARDRRVKAWARGAGIRWDQLPQSAVIRGRHDRDRWAAARNRFMARDVVPEPGTLPPVALVSDPLPRAAELGLEDDPCPERQAGGRVQALALLDSFLTARGQSYRSAMSTPLEGAKACSRLSPHFAFGTLTLREAVQATAARQRAVRQAGTRDGWAGSLKSFQSRLAWRDHFIQKLEDEPELEWRALHRMYDGLRPTTPDAARLEAWQKGETGVPFVDACMRSLHATGWLNFRMRSMLMSFASYHLWLPWQVTGRHLARLFTDYEPGIHWSQAQMQSGTTGINTLRIYNPVKQGYDQDPQGIFTRRWCPELADLPDRTIHEPWKADTRPDYPAPIVEPAAAAKAARDAVWAVRKSSEARTESARVVKKHASRKDRHRHFVNDRAPRRRARPVDDRQGSLDL
jgi:deoxyribodipyrimidine photo-lyase